MQGINRAKHAHLVDALLGLEKLLHKKSPADECVRETAEYLVQLETLYENYENLLAELSRSIIGYEALYSTVKTQFLGKKLKELKKEISVDKPALSMLIENIQLAYGT